MSTGGHEYSKVCKECDYSHCQESFVRKVFKNAYFDLKMSKKLVSECDIFFKVHYQPI